MTAQEFSSQFDIFWNNIMSNQAPGLDEYEKSVFLTRAQENLVKNYFTPKANGLQEGIGESPKRQADFSNLIANISLWPSGKVVSFDPRSFVFEYPSNIFLIINELVIDNSNGALYTVVPIAYTVYDQLMSKPYKRPKANTVWKIVTGAEVYEGNPLEPEDTGIQPLSVTPRGLNTLDVPQDFDEETFDNEEEETQDDPEENQTPIKEYRPLVEIIGPTKLSGEDIEYKIRYVRKPYPIIVGNITGETIDGKVKPFSKGSPCELPEELHSEIIMEAVKLAKIAWIDTKGTSQQKVNNYD